VTGWRLPVFCCHIGSLLPPPSPSPSRYVMPGTQPPIGMLNIATSTADSYKIGFGSRQNAAAN
jgi:hypothetical protein